MSGKKDKIKKYTGTIVVIGLVFVLVHPTFGLLPLIQANKKEEDKNKDI